MVRFLALAVALAAVPAAAQQAVPLLQPGEALVQVSATGEVKAVPDRAEVSTGVTADAASARAALAANAARAERLVAALRTAGVPERAMRTSDLSVGPRYRPAKDGGETDEVIGYRASNRLTVTVAASEAGRIVDALGEAGATSISGPRFSFADEDSVRRRARDAAVRDAQQRARDYADAFGLKALRPVRVSERRSDIDGGTDIVVTGTRAGSPVLPGEQTVSATVWVDYAASR